MTIRQCIKKNGLQSEVESFKRWQSVDVDFINSDGEDDETQFDIHTAGTKKGIEDLSNLFSEFCKENGFKTNTVTSVTVVRSGYTLEELDQEAA